MVSSVLGDLLLKLCDLLLLLSELVLGRLFLVLQSGAHSFLASQLSGQSIDLRRELPTFRVQLLLQLFNLLGVGLLLAVQSLLHLREVLVHSLVGLVQKTEFIFILSDDLFGLFDRVSELQLDHLYFFLVLLLVLPQLLLMLADKIVQAFGSALLLVGESLFKAVFVCLVELAKLLELLFGLLYDLLCAKVVLTFCLL